MSENLSVRPRTLDTLSRRQLVRGLIAAGAILPATTAMSAPATATQSMAEEQVLRHAFQVKLTSFHPPDMGISYDGWIARHVFLPPFLADEELNLLPGTCQQLDVSPDGLTYTLHVDPAAAWSDGSRFTSGDIKAYMEWLSSPANPGPNKTDLRLVKGHQAVNEGTAQEMEGLVTPDDLTLQILLDQPDPNFTNNVLAHQRFGTVKVGTMTANPQDWWLQDPPVTGPYTIENFDADAGEYSFVPNPAWWREPKPILTKIEAATVEDPQTIRLLWDNDQVDMAFIFGEGQMEIAEEYPDSVRRTFHQFPVFWMFNHQAEPTNDLNVRKALRHAVDAPAVAQAIYQGRKPIAKGLLPNMEGNRYDTIDTQHEFFTFDPELARAELAQSPYGSAGNLPPLLVTPSSASGDLVRATEIVVEMWRQNLDITNIEFRPSPPDFGEDWAATVNVMRNSLGTLPDAAAMLTNFAYSKGSLAGYFGGYNNAEMDAMIEQLIPMDREDPAYVDLVQQAEDTFLADYPYIPLIIEEFFFFVKPWVRNAMSNYYLDIYTLPRVSLAPH